MGNDKVLEFNYAGKAVSLSTPAGDHIGKVVQETHGFYEIDLLSAIETAPLAEGIIVDVGANVGNHSVFFSKIMGRKVLAFEPMPEARRYLARNVIDNGVVNAVEVRPLGLGAAPTKAAAKFESPDNLGATQLTPDDSGDLEISTLDLQTMPGHVAVLKIDTEGMDVDVLRGGLNLIKTDRPLILIEAADAEGANAVHSLLSGINYTPLGVFGATDTYLYCPTGDPAEVERANKIAWGQVLRAQALSRNRLQLTRGIERTLVGLESRMKLLEKASQDVDDIREAVDQLRDATSYQLNLRIDAQVKEFSRVWSGIAQLRRQLEKTDTNLKRTLSGPVYRNITRIQSGVRKLKQKLSGTKPIAKGTSGSKVARQLGWPIKVKRRARMERGGRANLALATELPTNPLISVIMTTFNSAQSVERAADSILQQSYRKLELIIVDDDSTDNTRQIIQAIGERDGRVRIIQTSPNRGTYWAKNIGITEARGEVVTFMDSDDVSRPDRIQKQLDQLSAAEVVATVCNCVRVDEAGNIVLNRGLSQRTAPISLMIKREVVQDIGYFDSVRTSADDEFQTRLRRSYPKRSFRIVAEPLYIATARSESLSTSQGNAVDLSSTDSDFLSPARRHYLESYLTWHEKVFAAERRPYVPFPVTNRPFEVHEKLLISGDKYQHEPVSAFMATFPPREVELEKTVQSLIRQVDHLYVYMNGYDRIPEFLKNPRITALPAAGAEDLRDIGKFYHMANAEPGYFLTVDDDIAYPSDYVERLVQGIERYNRRAIVGVHGMIFPNPIDRFFSANRTVYSFKHPLEEDKVVNALGTGTTAFHSSLLTIGESVKEAKGMADVWLAVEAKRLGIPMVSIKRPSAWMMPVNKKDEGPNLFEEFRQNDSRQTAMLHAAGDWPLPSDAISGVTILTPGTSH